MSASVRFTPRSRSRIAGYTLLELLVAVAIMLISMVAVTAFFESSVHQMRSTEIQTETTQAARAAVDAMVRDLRLSGACLPTTGDFIALTGIHNGSQDSITTRSGLAQPNMSCVITATVSDTPVGATSIAVQNVSGFAVGSYGYIRNTDGTGEFFTITGIDSGTDTLTRDSGSSADYPVTSGVYQVDQRYYYIDQTATPWGTAPELVLQVGNQSPESFAIGIESLDISYQLNRSCPPCDTVSLPASATEWSLVQEVFFTVTARSIRRNAEGQYYRRTLSVAVKPRNLLPD